MKICLKHLPSKNSYPNGDTDLKYFVSFTKWFHSLFELKSKQMYCDFRPLPPKPKSLALQINAKHAICKHDFVLIYATMLRAIGIQCRVVINMLVAPLKPPQNELFAVSSKPLSSENATQDKKKTKTKQSNESNALKKSKLDVEPPQKDSKAVSDKSKKSAEDQPKSTAKKSNKIAEPENISVTKKTNKNQTSTSEKKLKVSHGVG